MDYINKQIDEIRNLQKQLISKKWTAQIETAVATTTNALNAGKKILFAGNGGSAADAQHMAGEFVSRFEFDRPGLAGIALTVDTSILTACGNDYGYEQVFSRQVDAIGNEGDVLWVYTTSGKSPNILRAMEVAKNKKMEIIAFCGENTDLLEKYTSKLIAIESTRTPRIQEWHLISGHLICGSVENNIFA